MKHAEAGAPSLTHDREPGLRWEPLTLGGWGRTVAGRANACAPRTIEEARLALATAGREGVLAVGAGRSYGDAGLNSGGRVVLARGFDRIDAFDADTGRIVCGAGVTFRQLLDEYLPRGFIAPVTPGTAEVTLGGALANDVHGKNHDRVGSFGDHVEWLELLLPNGDAVLVSPQCQPELFAATVGGVGLSGIVLRLCFRMEKLPSSTIVAREERVASLEGMLARLAEARCRATHSIAWVDALAGGARRGRGVLLTGEPAACPMPARSPGRRLSVGMDFPALILNTWSMRAFNEVYYRRAPSTVRERAVHVEKFFYPLDAIRDWNRMYGRRGFYQFQCVLPEAESARGIPRLLQELTRWPVGAFLASLKTLGGEGRGYLSFPMRGYTLALDVPNRSGARALLGALERITLDCGGRVYLAKDACLSAAALEVMYPRLGEFRAVLREVDPECRMQSDLARRLGIRRQDAALSRAAERSNQTEAVFSLARHERVGAGGL